MLLDDEVGVGGRVLVFGEDVVSAELEDSALACADPLKLHRDLLVLLNGEEAAVLGQLAGAIHEEADELVWELQLVEEGKELRLDLRLLDGRLGTVAMRAELAGAVVVSVAVAVAVGCFLGRDERAAGSADNESSVRECPCLGGRSRHSGQILDRLELAPRQHWLMLAAVRVPGVRHEAGIEGITEHPEELGVDDEFAPNASATWGGQAENVSGMAHDA